MTEPLTGAVVVLTTAGSDPDAAKIAEGLVERRLAACVNIVREVDSVFRWEGKLQREGERLLVIKTRASRAAEVLAAIREYSSYDCPEGIVLPIMSGLTDYLTWLEEAASGEAP